MADILINGDELRQILAHSLKDALRQSGYDNATRPFVRAVLEEHKAEIEAVLRKVLQGVMSDPEFADIVRQEFKHKVAKMLVGDLSGAVEQAVNQFRQNPTLKADMVKAVEALIEKQETA
ncbi:MAG: hypothetical protein KGL39_53140 [Patescibacteria group bacterium]|nr:hypothetical protein [Patescibacteria group bacterium]